MNIDLSVLITPYTQNVMDDKILENCPYSDSGHCPQPDAVARAYLIPQLVDRSQVEASEQVCRTCGKYLDEKREHPRVRRPLQIILLQGEKTVVEGVVVNISESGALVKLNDWVDFGKDEKITLEIYSSPAAFERVSAPVVRVSGLIGRIDRREQQLAIAFLKEFDQ